MEQHDLAVAILYVDEGYVVAEKPHGMPTAPLRSSARETDSPPTLLDTVAASWPEVRSVAGFQPHEGGLLHRLDTATHGLVVLARTQAAFEVVRRGGEAGVFTKWYAATCERVGERAARRGGWPYLAAGPVVGAGSTIVSAFRPWGPGRRRVVPVPIAANRDDDPGAQRLPVYTTWVESIEDRSDGSWCARLRLVRGFRHQVRAHLAWCGLPIVGDAFYNGAPITRDGSAPQRIELHAVAVCLRLPDRLIEVALPGW